MIIMDGFVVFSRVIHRVLFKADAALLVSIDELEVVKGFPSLGGLNLLLLVQLQGTKRILGLPKGVDDLFGGRDVRAGRRGG